MNSSTKDICMKHALGKTSFIWGILLLFIISDLDARDFAYTLKVDNPHPYVKEAVILSLEINQSNPDVVLLIDFDLLKSDDYTFAQVKIKETDDYHAKKITYSYLVYPLREGDVALNFKLTQKVTTDDSVAYSFSGDRDNVKGLVTQDSIIALNPVNLSVKSLEKDTVLVGDFHLNYRFDKHQAKAHEPLPFHFTIKGEGYPPLLKNILPKDINFTHFKEKPRVHSNVDLEGTHNTITYAMALAHHQNFHLPPLSFKAFNPKTQKYYTLRIPLQKFEIEAMDKDSLSHQKNNPPLLQKDWSWVEHFLKYLLVFVAGFFSALLLKYTKRTKQKKPHGLKTKIENCLDNKALLQLLLAHPDDEFVATIEKLEKVLYGNAKIPLHRLKKEALETIK